MIKKYLYFIVLFFCCFFVHGEVVKKSKSGICHDKYSIHYNKTTKFKPFDTLEHCLNSGGRLPKKYNSNGSSLKSFVATNYSGMNSTKYSRNQFGSGWADLDNDCQNSRMEALISQSVGQVQYTDSKHCKVKSGKWISPFTGNTIYNASDIDIDHVVPLKWAWIHGADSWPKEKRVEIANDPANLLSVESSLNRQKGAKGLDEWLPPTNQCQYIVRFLRIYKTYGLTLKNSEASLYTAIKSRYCSK